MWKKNNYLGGGNWNETEQYTRQGEDRIENNSEAKEALITIVDAINTWAPGNTSKYSNRAQNDIVMKYTPHSSPNTNPVVPTLPRALSPMKFSFLHQE